MQKIDGPHQPIRAVILSEKIVVFTLSSVAAFVTGFMIFTGIAWLSYWAMPLWSVEDTAQIENITQVKYSVADDSGQRAAAEPTVLITDDPTRLEIPTLNITTAIQSLGITKDGAMDVPNNTKEVGWFQPGYRPGELGNAVITGHFDTLLMQPAIFARIDELKIGDEVIVVTKSDQRLVFKVVETDIYPLKDMPIAELFGPSDSARLNLITCSGQWSWKVGTYLNRTVVKAEIARIE